MRKSLLIGAAAVAALVGGVSIANAANESSTINYNVKSVKGKFNQKGFKPAKLTFGVNISPGAGEATILPMKVADMRFPSNKVMRFTPKKGLPVCKLTGTALSVSPELAYSKCGKSVIGNGEATFQLGQSTAPAAFNKGTVVVLYGGKSGKNIKIKFSAYSGDTNAGVYTEGILQPSGRMNIAMPVLTADSSVTSLNLAIPGTTVNGTWASGDPYSLRAGLDKGFVKVKCRANQTLKFSTGITLGARNPISGVPYGPETKLNPTSSSKCGR